MIFLPSMNEIIIAFLFFKEFIMLSFLFLTGFGHLNFYYLDIILNL